MQIYHGTEQTLEADTFLSLLQSDYESVFLTDCIIDGTIVFSPESEVDVEGKFAVDKEIVCIRCTFKNLIKIVTFTTLGFGDVVAANTFARILVTLEVMFGYIMLGGLISIFANKLASRS